MREQFSAMAFVLTAPILEAMQKHALALGLTRGTLPPEQFVHFMQQDSLYRVDRARALALAGAKMSREEDMELVLELARQTLLYEREMRRAFFKQYRIQPAEEKGPAGLACSAHLLARASLGTPAEGMAALLPRFWLYRETGTRMRKHAAPNGPYAKWIETYSSKEYSLLVTKAVDLADRLAGDAGEDERDRMFAAFVYASRLECGFWDESARAGSWSV